MQVCVLQEAAICLLIVALRSAEYNNNSLIDREAEEEAHDDRGKINTRHFEKCHALVPLVPRPDMTMMITGPNISPFLRGVTQPDWPQELLLCTAGGSRALSGDTK